ncbi:hypothetical protein BJ122_102233 [Rhodopseudomonas faecalis]|uniref:Holliday junction resolvasome RuvABC endonuclease subunit n=1 Tax=Rhodopseudomonas faecalis TaxID=99655 RepID=A0A318TMB4_9BRAD|nr:hypothetical protein [Rhodopseudomonas faecalis]PYF05007.1 hypothetical protein BJ122_102233 [Rhodopseudomonas faecalis]
MAWAGDILALDLAKTTGWAYGAPGEEPIYGSVTFGNENTTRARVLRNCREWMVSFLVASPARLVVFEAPLTPGQLQGHTNIDSIRLLIGIAETVDELLFDRADVREARVSDVRTFFLGTNRIKRADAKDATKYKCRKLGWSPQDDNAADALALWCYQAAHMAPQHSVKLLPLWGA